MVNGNSTDSRVERTDTMTTVTTKLDFSGGNISHVVGYSGLEWKKVEITGTQMIPEFPIALLVLVIALSSIIFLGNLRKLTGRISNR
ncbi:MAG: PEFG-CTERM sorting domain-containing protein [Thaumarchaeota archaeon]|nr:MAG: PEFG-CTERM sorting domain-containing protein [Nitrososphaerota archaeon]